MGRVTKQQSAFNRQIIINAALQSFLKNGYTNTTIKQITTELGISAGALTGHFKTKEDILYELVSMVSEQQFGVSNELVEGKTDDKILLYAVEEALQLYIVDMNENILDIYNNAYSHPKTAALIQQKDTELVAEIFKEQLPHYETKDFYMLAIASGGIMRGFMISPSNIWFTIEMKVEAYLRNMLRIYYVPDEKIYEAVALVKTIDFRQVAKDTEARVLNYLEEEKNSLQTIK